jgi:hypothetical protein
MENSLHVVELILLSTFGMSGILKRTPLPKFT